MPPYTPVKSKAQSRKLFSLASQGKLSLDEAKGKTRAANYSSLPEHVSQKAHGLRAAAKARRGR